MIIYKLIEEKHNDEILGHYTSFGISAFDNSSDKNYVYVEDVFTNAETAKEYIALFNDEKLELTHLEEAIEDILHSCQI